MATETRHILKFRLPNGRNTMVNTDELNVERTISNMKIDRDAELIEHTTHEQHVPSWAAVTNHGRFGCE